MIWAVSLMCMNLITHVLTAEYTYNSIRSLIVFNTSRRSYHTFSALPPLC